MGTRGLEAVFHVAVPADDLLAILWNVDHFGRLFPDVKEITVERRHPGEPEVLDLAYRVDAVVKEVCYVLRRELDPEGRAITWKELSGDLKRVRGGWWVETTDAPGVSRLVYRAFVDIGRFVPTRLVAKSAKRKAGEMVARIREAAGAIYREQAGPSKSTH